MEMVLFLMRSSDMWEITTNYGMGSRLCMSVCVCACMYAYMHVCVFVCVHMCVYVCVAACECELITGTCDCASCWQCYTLSSCIVYNSLDRAVIFCDGHLCLSGFQVYFG